MQAKTKLEQLKEQKKNLERRIQMAEAREKTKDKKKDTRRKILLGAYYLDKTTKDNSMDEIKKLMDRYLTRDSDRILFDLPIKAEKDKGKK